MTAPRDIERGALEGVPARIELSTPDLARASAFYGAVLGWTFVDDGDGRLARCDGGHVARLHRGSGSSATWTLYVAVDDADEVCERLVELGGSILHDPEEVDGARLFLALDPGGAEFGGCEVDEPVARGSGPGTLVGADAASGEPGQSRTFYQRLFSYRYDGSLIIGPDGRSLGTLDIAGDALPHWRPRFGVVDLAAATDAATTAGGTVLTHGNGTATLADDAGALLVLVEIRA